MAIATITATEPPSPRRAAAASAPRVPPRVYSPFATKRRTRPMAVRVDGGTTRRAPTRWSPFHRDAPERSG